MGKALAIVPDVGLSLGRLWSFEGSVARSLRHLKWSQKTGQSAKVYPVPLKGYEDGKAPELYRAV
jgi:hypothetical protein